MIVGIKRIISKISLLSILLLLMVSEAYSLEVVTHRAINEHISKNNISGFSINDYLKNQLGFLKGYDENFNGKEVFKWIGDGGVEEDDGARPVNHFHDPISNKGLFGGTSALEWAMLPVSAQNLAPLSSWYDVRSTI